METKHIPIKATGRFSQLICDYIDKNKKLEQFYNNFPNIESFKDQIQRIALPALAAILVYTGYMLSSPQNFIRILKIGKEQLLIFLITLVTSLISGIIFGTCSFILLSSLYGKEYILNIFIGLKKNNEIYKLMTVFLSLGIVYSFLPSISLSGHIAGILSGFIIFIL